MHHILVCRVSVPLEIDEKLWNISKNKDLEGMGPLVADFISTPEICTTSSNPKFKKCLILAPLAIRILVGFFCPVCLASSHTANNRGQTLLYTF